MTAEFDALIRKAQAGELAAQIALGKRFEEAGDASRARNWFARAAQAGSTAGVRALGCNLLTQEPILANEGVGMVRDAASAGDAEALYLCALLAAQDDNLRDRWRITADFAAQAAERGWAFAKSEIEFLKTIEPLTDLARAKPVYVQSEDPRISIIENCASPGICRWLIERAAPLLKRAEVYDPEHGKGREEHARNNTAADFNLAQSDLVMTALRARIAATIGLSEESLERPSILHYETGERFEPHYDFLNPHVPAYAQDIAKRGQRVATFLIYLNEDFDGGETSFPTVRYKYKGRTGDAILFWNVDEAGEPDRRMLHAGLSPTRGEKWLLSQWLRARR